MPTFTIETTYHLPIFRHGTYQADTPDEACRLAIEDDDWSDEKSDWDSSGETYVSGVWQGADSAYRGPALLDSLTILRSDPAQGGPLRDFCSAC